MHDRLALELVVVLGVALVAGTVAGERLRIAPPVLLLGVGASLAFVPSLRAVHLPPEIVLLVFLPPLLYWEAITTSLRDIRRDLRGVILMGTALVIATAAGVAAAAHALGMSWGPAWVLGAALAPTDATAVAALARALPRRNLTLLRAESLINDGTALVVFGLAVAVTVGEEHLSPLLVSWRFLVSYGGGALAGVVIWWLAVQARRRLDDPLQENIVALLVPFTAFLLAETAHASGVLAAVVSGLLMSRSAPRLVRADTRQQAWAFWSLSAYALNGVLFVLIGLEAHAAIRGLTGEAFLRGLLAAAVIALVLVVVRFGFLFAATYLIRLVDRRPEQRLRRVSHRARVVSGMSGFRGAVSLAAALAVPEVLGSGSPFPDRDMIVFVTASVVITTLVVHGLLLPRVVRWARLPGDTSADQERYLAETSAAEEALAALPDVATELAIAPEVVDRVRSEIDERLLILGTTGRDDHEPTLHREQQYTALRLALIGRKRDTVVRLRDQGAIDDTVLRQVQAQLDLEEVRLSRREVID